MLDLEIIIQVEDPQEFLDTLDCLIHKSLNHSSTLDEAKEEIQLLIFIKNTVLEHLMDRKQAS